MKIFITGGTGFVGFRTMEKLASEGHTLLLLSRRQKTKIPLFKHSGQINVVKGNLKNIKKLKSALKKFRPQATIHMAWEGIPDYGPEMSIKNLYYGLNLINLLAEIKCKIFVSTGSCWEYGSATGKLSENTPSRPFNAFTAAKNSLHWLGREIAKKNGMQFIWTRLFYVYGPGQREESLIPYLINCARTGKKPEIKNPFAKNDFIYVEDVADAISAIFKKCKENYSVYNIGSGNLSSIQEILKIIFGHFAAGKKFKRANPRQTDKLSNFYADISKIKKETGWKPKINIREGIRQMIK